MPVRELSRARLLPDSDDVRALPDIPVAPVKGPLCGGPAAGSLMTLPELFRTFPDERGSALWLAAIRWGAQIWCPACGSKRYLVSGVRSPRHVSQRYRCRDCKGHFSVRKGTVIQKTKISLRDWVLAIHLVSTDTDLKTSRLTLHDALGISRPTAVRVAKKLEVFPKRRKLGKVRRKWGAVLVDLEIRNLKVEAQAHEIAKELLRPLTPPDPSLRIISNPRI